MINPCSVSCRAVISYSLSYDAWGASTYLALKHATALDMADKENQNPETFTGNPQWGTEIPPEYDLTEPTARK